MELNKQLLRNVALILFCGSIAVGCGGGSTEVQTSSTTMGQELMDLEKSYEKGIISEKQYKDAKEQILDRYN